MPRTFIFMSEFGEILDLALHLKYIENEDVLMHIDSADYKKIGEGMIEKIDNWAECIGEGYIWVFDGCNHGKLQDWLRAQGEFVFGGSEKGDMLENERQLGQKLFKQMGFKQPESHNFKKISEALSFVEKNKDRRWILKQNGDAPKSLNHMGKFPGSEDMIYHLKHLEKAWNEAEYGKFDCDLMEVVEGTEIAASAFFNGKDWLTNADGKVVGYLNFEEKKEAHGGLGETCGEMGTTFIGVTEENDIFNQIIMSPKLKQALVDAGFHGVFDINGCILEDGDFVGFEPTCRFGIPATSYEFIEGLESKASDLIEAVAKGEKTTLELHYDVGMVMVVAGKPFPLEGHVEDEMTSMGERLWLLKDEKPIKNMTKEQAQRLHLFNFIREENEETKDIEYKVATESGYLLTVTGKGEDLEEVRDELIDFIKENIYIPGMKYRKDIGARVEDDIEVIKNS